MPAQPTSFPPRAVFPIVDDPRTPAWRSRPWRLGPGLLLALLMLPRLGLAEGCAAALAAMPRPADATEILRDDAMVIHGLAMCQLAYTTRESVDNLIARYQAHWRRLAGERMRRDTNGDGIDDQLMHRDARYSRQLRIETSGQRQAVMVSLIDHAGEPPIAPRADLPLPAAFSIDYRARDASGAMVFARTDLPVESAMTALIDTARRHGWQLARRDRTADPPRHRLIMARHGATIDVHGVRASGMTRMMVRRISVRASDE